MMLLLLIDDAAVASAAVDSVFSSSQLSTCAHCYSVQDVSPNIHSQAEYTLSSR
jgi:hypothetical protein